MKRTAGAKRAAWDADADGPRPESTPLEKVTANAADLMFPLGLREVDCDRFRVLIPTGIP